MKSKGDKHDPSFRKCPVCAWLDELQEHNDIYSRNEAWTGEAGDGAVTRFNILNFGSVPLITLVVQEVETWQRETHANSVLTACSFPSLHHSFSHLKRRDGGEQVRSSVMWCKVHSWFTLTCFRLFFITQGSEPTFFFFVQWPQWFSPFLCSPELSANPMDHTSLWAVWRFLQCPACTWLYDNTGCKSMHKPLQLRHHHQWWYSLALFVFRAEICWTIRR